MIVGLVLDCSIHGMLLLWLSYRVGADGGRNQGGAMYAEVNVDSSHFSSGEDTLSVWVVKQFLKKSSIFNGSAASHIRLQHVGDIGVIGLFGGWCNTR